MKVYEEQKSSYKICSTREIGTTIRDVRGTPRTMTLAFYFDHLPQIITVYSGSLCKDNTALMIVPPMTEGSSAISRMTLTLYCRPAARSSYLTPRQTVATSSSGIRRLPAQPIRPAQAAPSRCLVPIMRSTSPSCPVMKISRITTSESAVSASLVCHRDG